MATISKRGDYQYQAIIRRKGFPSQTRTFETRKEAAKWARDMESKVDQGLFRDRPGSRADHPRSMHSTATGGPSPSTSAARSPKKTASNSCRPVPCAQRSLSSLQSCDFAAYRDTRRQQVSANTVRLELALLSHLYTVAIQEWSMPLEHALKNIKKPKPGPGPGTPPGRG